MFTLETERRVPGPKLEVPPSIAEILSLGLGERQRQAQPPWINPAPYTEKENFILPIPFTLYNLHFFTLPPRKHKYPEQPTIPFSKEGAE